jgi:hypothetical protein
LRSCGPGLGSGLTMILVDNYFKKKQEKKEKDIKEITDLALAPLHPRWPKRSLRLHS